MRTRLAIAMIVGSLGLIAVGGGAALAESGGAGNLSPCAGFAEGQTVTLVDSCFDATAHFAHPGDITIRNDGIVTHSYTSADGAFDAGSLAEGATRTIHIDKPGVYRVYCVLHGNRNGAGMAGVLIVGDVGAVAVDAPAPVTAASSRSRSIVPWLVLLVGLVLVVGSCAAALRRRTQVAT